jgi:uncharacterized protein YbjT (DUF2867 family)
MTQIAVIGATGTIGRLIVPELKAAGAEVRMASRHSPEHPVDLTTGAGLEPALAGCELVVDASNGSPVRPEPVLVDGARRLAEAAARAGVGRIVCVSIVGIEQVPTRYYRAKVAQEEILRAAPLPVTIVRSTQFHELLDWVFSAAAKWRLSPRVPARLQPVAAAEAARAVAEVARRPDPPALVTVGGPEIEDAGALARAWASDGGRRLVPIPIAMPPRVARPVRAGALTAADPDVVGQMGFAEWLRARS